MEVTIITINFNNKNGLERTARSVVSQTCRDYEWIVIDGGSTDGSVDIIDQYSDHITYSVCEPDSGIYNAMNKGVDASKGEYLIFMNSGDCFHDSEVLSDFMKLAKTADIIYGNTERVDADGNKVGQVVPSKYLSLQYLFFKCLNHQAIFFSRKCFECDRYDESFRLLGDMELTVRLAMRHFSFHYWNRFVAKYDVTGISAFTDTRKEIVRAVEKNVPKFILLDYNESTYNDSDIAMMSREIIESNRVIRNLARIALYPVYGIHKLLRRKIDNR